MNKHLIVCDECGKEELRSLVGRPHQKWVEVEAVPVHQAIVQRESVHLCSYECIADFGTRKVGEITDTLTPSLYYPQSPRRKVDLKEVSSD